MPTIKTSITTSPDHRIFGFDQRGQLRTNLYNEHGSPEVVALYSWAWAPTSRELAHKLATLWEQAIVAEEWDIIEELEAPPCSQCGSADVTAEPYDFGTDQETGYSDSGEAIHCLDCGAREQCEPETPVIARKATASEKPATTPRVAA
jgi:hypothetical protein